MRKYEAVVFDLDGVITDTASLHYVAWKRLADELGIYFDKSINELLKGVDRMSSLEIILQRAEKEYSGEEKAAMADRKNEYYRQLLLQMSPDNILPGAKELLHKLKSLQIKTALASASKNAFTVIERLSLRDFFDYIVDAEKVRHGKPDPEIFITAAKGIEIPCEKCIGVEDSNAGIRAIKSAGMFAVGVGSPLTLSEADDIIDGLDKFIIENYL